jgi:tyramine---L-glutamate ligase
VRLLTSRDPRMSPVPGVENLLARPGEDWPALFTRGAAAADAVWPTAPETGGALEALSRRTLALGLTLLGCRPEAVRLTASKHATAALLAREGIPVVPTFRPGEEIPDGPGTWVVKPDDGAGSEDTCRVAGAGSARERLARSPGDLVAQPWLDGDPVSLSLLCADGEARVLSCNRLRIAIRDGQVSLQRIEVNALAGMAASLAWLAERIARAIPGLWGYLGADLVLTPEGPVVLEINPRLTTSYCGLGRALGRNIAAEVLGLLEPGGLARFAPSETGVAVPLELEPARGE